MFRRSLRLVLGIAAFGALVFTVASEDPQALVTVGIAEPHHSAEYPTVIYPHGFVPRWDKKFLVERRPGWEKAHRLDTPLVNLYDSRGGLVLKARIWIPGAASVGVHKAAATEQGGVLAIGHAVMTTGRIARYIAVTDTAGNTIHSIDTGTFAPQVVCSAPDGTAWVAGIDFDKDRDKEDYSILRQYSFTAGLLRTYIPRRTLPRHLVLSHGAPSDGLHCTPDRVALYLYPSHIYFELERGDETPKRWDVRTPTLPEDAGLYFARTVMTDSGRLYANIGDAFRPPLPESHECIHGLYELRKTDSQHASWELVIRVHYDSTRTEGFRIGSLLGADGDSLVGNGRYLGRLVWVRPILGPAPALAAARD